MISYRKKLIKLRKERASKPQEVVKETPGSVLLIPAGSNFVAPMNMTLSELSYSPRSEDVPTLSVVRFDGTDELVQGLSKIKLAKGDSLRIPELIDLTARVS